MRNTHYKYRCVYDFVMRVFVYIIVPLMAVEIVMLIL